MCIRDRENRRISYWTESEVTEVLLLLSNRNPFEWTFYCPLYTHSIHCQSFTRYGSDPFNSYPFSSSYVGLTSWFDFRHSLQSLLPFVHSHLNYFLTSSLALPSSSLLRIHDSQKDSVIRIQAILNPLTKEMQRLSSLLVEIRSILPISYEILLLPESDYSSLPLMSFYRYVLQDSSQAVWHNLPNHYVYPCLLYTSLL